jgi:hypothetical protein
MGLETVLLGAAASGAGATATAATAGLFGTAGAFSLGTTIGTLSTGLSLLSGAQGLMAGNQQSKQAIAQTTANIQEQTRQATRSAYNEKQAAESARRQQKIAYLASGVSLSGSPLAVLEETRQKGLSNAAEIMSANETYSSATGLEGMARASSLKSSGRSEFIKGVTGALSNYANK